ncbi:tumor necrosis factor ligand superfamily member 14 isoform X2 [Cottoperca gobio]|nr:tumor necrosis factor ligand superfamily member 14-like isoform X2 [Cottoperca gobio]XP_029292772.1 tumor necrosis factor ligand superfamily member 14-like isoform X2 [Cottoperca gobio]XP_029292773.1 tumor necrosis factor ligand superfamily member 14-like isoform X2 [Cottoperca gobio]
MSTSGYPPVFVVDAYATRPPLPPKLSQRRRHAGATQILLILLVSMALCGMAIEACFIYHLYQTDNADSASSSKLIAGQEVTSPTEIHSLVLPPSKPVAHLTGGQDVVHGKEIMAWSMDAEPLLYEMDYKNRCIVIQKEGYYYVYSKVYFLDFDGFHHSVNRKTDRYVGKSIPLLMSKRYTEMSREKRSNSYIGGVFHLTVGDAIFVEVSNTTKIVRNKPFENVFGIFMI